MFGWLAKRTKAYKTLEAHHKTLSDDLAEAQDMVEMRDRNLDDLMEKVKTGGLFVEEGNSSVVFEIDGELNVTVKSRINKDITNVLIDHNYITSAQSEDESAINFAFVLIANEATEQVIENINNHEEN